MYHKRLTMKYIFDSQEYKKLNKKVKKALLKAKNEVWEKHVMRWTDLWVLKIQTCMEGGKWNYNESQRTGRLKITDPRKWVEYYTKILTDDREEFLSYRQ